MEFLLNFFYLGFKQAFSEFQNTLSTLIEERFMTFFELIQKQDVKIEEIKKIVIEERQQYADIAAQQSQVIAEQQATIGELLSKVASGETDIETAKAAIEANLEKLDSLANEIKGIVEIPQPTEPTA